jgi:hypothetical protein
VSVVPKTVGLVPALVKKPGFKGLSQSILVAQT